MKYPTERDDRAEYEEDGVFAAGLWIAVGGLIVLIGAVYQSLKLFRVL